MRTRSGVLEANADVHMREVSRRLASYLKHVTGGMKLRSSPPGYLGFLKSDALYEVETPLPSRDSDRFQLTGNRLFECVSFMELPWYPFPDCTETAYALRIRYTTDPENYLITEEPGYVGWPLRRHRSTHIFSLNGQTDEDAFYQADISFSRHFDERMNDKDFSDRVPRTAQAKWSGIDETFYVEGYRPIELVFHALSEFSRTHREFPDFASSLRADARKITRQPDELAIPV